MTIPPRLARIGALGALASTLIIGGTATAATAVTQPAPRTVVSSQVIAAVGDICYSDLPTEAHDTLDLIEQGGPYPYPQDGTVFQNREGVLPSQSSGYYHEYTVITPGSDDRGARRIVTGQKTDEDYYTSDHYASFDLVDYGC
ncbi:ribonuclease [Streptomyces sp. NPDC044780]|uniref:Ribonuclease n=1 Tax=Streptomyces luomodiensis TaxID=3026192 RepID=A0ABY9V5F0_9ACTN|nr:ribonuclease [Streptomyces sp. SCA4-21]WNE99517.1 ribonuclease [Streptomyces sp. SCA4-21]